MLTWWAGQAEDCVGRQYSSAADWQNCSSSSSNGGGRVFVSGHYQ